MNRSFKSPSVAGRIPTPGFVVARLAIVPGSLIKPVDAEPSFGKSDLGGERNALDGCPPSRHKRAFALAFDHSATLPNDTTISKCIPTRGTQTLFLPLSVRRPVLSVHKAKPT